MSALVLLSLLGITLFVPALSGNDDPESDVVEPEPVEPEPVDTEPDEPEPVEPETDDAEPEEPEPVEPETEEPLTSATAILDESTNVVTVTTDPEETGTIYTVANRVDAVIGSGSPNYVYETSVLLAPEGLDLSGAIEDELDPSKSVYYYDVLNRLGVTELAVFPLDLSAAPGAPGALPEFVYPEDAELGFAQIYSTNFGDGGQIDLISDVEGEENLLDDISDIITTTTYSQVEDNGGAVVTLPSDFDGTLGVFETTTDFFFNDQLVRTEVSIQFAKIDAGTDFTAGTLAQAQEVTQTEAETGPVYTISDGSLTERELLNGADGVSAGGFSYVVSATEYDSEGAIIYEETMGGVVVDANVEIERYAVETVGTASPLSNEDALWYVQTGGRLVTSFNPIENVAAEGGDFEAVSVS